MHQLWTSSDLFWPHGVSSPFQLHGAVVWMVAAKTNCLAKLKLNWLTSWGEVTVHGWNVQVMAFKEHSLSLEKTRKRKCSAIKNKTKPKKPPQKNNKGWFNRSCLVYKPWFSYISYVFHGAIKARGNPQCLQPLLNITRFGPRGHILWLGRLLEKGGAREGRWGWRRGEKKGERKGVGSKGKVFKM